MALTDIEHSSETIPTNLRLLMVLEAVARNGMPVTPTDINMEIGLPKPTIHRLFATLEAEGYLQRELDGRTYTIGQRFRRVSINALSSLRVRTARLAVLGALAEDIGETCNISLPDRDAMIYLDRVETKWPLRIQLPIGTKVPFYCTASGKMYLSTLQDSHLERYLRSAHFERMTENTLLTADDLRSEIGKTRERGYSQDNEEFMEGMVALSVPINDDQGRLLSTLSFHAPTQRLSLKASHDYLPNLRATAKELERLILS
ncbi:MAG: IclR family transcriptional regulator [Pseudomonadota bacterium]